MFGTEYTAMRLSSAGRYSFVVTDNDSILREVGEEVFLQMRCLQVILQAVG